MKRWSWFAGLVWLLGCGSSDPQEGAATSSSSAGSENTEPTGPIVPLRFAWPDGLALRVVSHRTDERDGKRSSREVEHALRAEAVDGGLRITETDIKLTDSSGDERNYVVANAMARTTMVSRVNADGSFGGVENIDEIVAMSRKMFATEADKLTPEQRATLEQMFSAQTINALAAQDWNDRVGAWIGADLELGAQYEMRSQVPLAFPGSPIVKFLTRFGATELVPCADGEQPRCVKIESHNDVDPADMERAMRALFKGFGEPAGLEIEKLEVSTEMTLITDPATLVPRRLKLIKRVKLEMDTPEGDQASSKIEEKHITFTPIPAS